MRLSFEHLLALAGAVGISLIHVARASDIQLGMFTESGPNLFSALILSSIFELSLPSNFKRRAWLSSELSLLLHLIYECLQNCAPSLFTFDIADIMASALGAYLGSFLKKRLLCVASSHYSKWNQ